MAIQISGTTVINNDAELGSGLKSLYDAVTTTATNKTLVNREFCTVTADNLTLTLPANPASGWEVMISIAGLYNGTVVGRNGQNIMGLAENMTIDAAFSTINLVYIDSTRGWRLS